MRKYSILILSLLLIATSCGKKTDPKKNRQDMLREGHWSIQSGTLTVCLPDGRDTVLNYLDFMPKCRQDDYMIFHGGVDGAIFSNSFKCSPADADSITYRWSLTNGDNSMSLYHGFDFIYSVNEYILPFRFDTLNQSPLELDTLYGVLDTESGYTRIVPILDTIWEVRFDSVGLIHTDIHNSTISNFSENSFTLDFSIHGTYPDSTNHHTGMFIRLDAVPVDTIDFDPIIRPCSFRYKITYKKS